MQIGMVIGTVAEISPLTDQAVVLRLSQTTKVKQDKRWQRVRTDPLPIWFLEGRAKQLVETVHKGDVLSVTLSFRLNGDTVHLHADDFERFGEDR